MKINFKSLTIKNFLSYGSEPTVIPLDRLGTTLILGEDLDNTTDGIGANGVGKTVIINALAYGVYDKPVSNISKDNLVNNINKAHMEVVVEFEIDNKSYLIRRVRKSKSYAAGNFVELYENGVDITPDSVVNTNALIEKIVGLPYELFVRIVVFSATHTPFLDLPVRSQTGPNQTDIIEELFDLKTLSAKAENLQDLKREAESTLKELKARIELLENERGRHEKQLDNAKQRVITWDTTNFQEIEKLRKKLDKIKTIDVDAQRTLQDELIELTLTLGNATAAKQTTAAKYKQTEKELAQATKELGHLQDANCPYCLQQFADAKKKISGTKKVITALTKEIDVLEADLTAVEVIVKTEQTRQKEIQKQITVPKAELDEMFGKTSEFERRIIELEAAVNPYIEPLEELEAVHLTPIDYKEVNILDERVEHMKFLYKLLTKKDSFVRKVLLNKSLPFLNQRLQEYLTKLGLTHHVEFTHEMTASISQFGRVMDFGNLSNGQRARVNLALSFAFRDVLQTLHSHINICMLDEVLDVGLDGPGVTAAARMLKRKARDEKLSLYIISHRDEIDSAFDRVMTVQMNDGFSQIVEEL